MGVVYTGWNASIDLETLHDSIGCCISGESSGFGQHVAYAGDVNGDDIDDLMAGSEHFDLNRGAVYILHGRAGNDVWPSTISDGDVLIQGVAQGHTSNFFVALNCNIFFV